MGLHVAFALSVGTTFQGTIDAWQSADKVASSSQVNVCDTIGNVFKLSDVVMVEDNSSLTSNPDFVLAGGDLREEQLCQRYCYVGFFAHNGNCDSAGNPNVTGILPVAMRANPVLTAYSGSWRGSGALHLSAISNLSFSAMSGNSVTLYSTQTGTVNTWVSGFNGSMSVTLDAEL
jgi:hypothetical protein